MRDALCWISPFDSYAGGAAVVADAQRVNVPGHRTVVAIPTLYGVWPQQELSRAIGDALAVDGIEDALNVRAQIESQGVACAGWSVPRGNTGNPDAEGYAHGAMAAQFDTFLLNWEQGWGGFWTSADAGAVRAFFGGFWRALSEAGREDVHVIITFVTNSAMRQAVPADEETAWVEGSHAVALEAYIPGDPGLDPGNAVAIMRARLARDGHPDFPVIVILEQGDLLALAEQYSDPTWGVQFWTLATAARAAWPAPQPEDEDMALPPVDERYTANGWNDWRTVAINLQSIADTMGQQVETTAAQLDQVKAEEASQVASLNEQIASLQQQIAQLQETAPSVDATVLQARIDQLVKERDAAQQRAATLDAQGDALRSKLADIAKLATAA